MTLADRIAVMDRRPDRPGRHAGRDLRAADLALRRRLHRRHQHLRRPGRSVDDAARSSTAPAPADRSRSTAASLPPCGRRSGSRSGRRRSRISSSRPRDRRVNASRARSGTSAISATSRSITSRLDDRRHAAGRRLTNRARAWSSGRSPGTTRSGSAGPRRRRRADADEERHATCTHAVARSLAAARWIHRQSLSSWLAAVLFLVPFVIVLKTQLSRTAALALPPYRCRRSRWADGARPTSSTAGDSGSTLDNFTLLVAGRPLSRGLSVQSLHIAAISTLLHAARRLSHRLRHGAGAGGAGAPTLLMLVILPFWTSFLIRVYAWIGILKNEGLLNQFLLWIGVIDQPADHPQHQHRRSISASSIPTCRSWCCRSTQPREAWTTRCSRRRPTSAAGRCTAFWQVTFPLSLPGVIAGCMLVFIPAVGEFVIPDLLGGSDTLMIGKTLWDEFFTNRDWPLASAVAIVLLLLLVVPIVHLPAPSGRAESRSAPMNQRPRLVQRHGAGARLRLSLPADPAADHLLVQRFALVTVWGGFSTQLVRRAVPQRADARRGLGDAARSRFVAATVATVLGTLAGDRAGPLRAVSRPHRCSPAWSMRRW